MWRWLWKARKHEETAEVLRGTPTRPRTKTYSAETGFVYQYAYRGYRHLTDPVEAREHVFTVMHDRINIIPVRIQVRAVAVRTCEEQIGRNLLDAEQYAIAKLTLFHAFDKATEPTTLTEPIISSAEEMEVHLRHLGRV